MVRLHLNKIISKRRNVSTRQQLNFSQIMPKLILIWAMFTLPKDIEIKLNDPSQEQETWIFYRSEPHQR